MCVKINKQLASGSPTENSYVSSYQILQQVQKLVGK